MRRIAILLIVISLLLAAFAVVSAERMKPVTIPELGRISVPASLEVGPVSAKKGEGYYFYGRDGGIYRSTMMFATSMKMDGDVSGMPESDLFTALDMGLQAFNDTDSRILRKGDPVALNVGSRKAATVSCTVFTSGMVQNIQMYVINGGTEIKILMFMTPDSDAAYWETLRSSIVEQAVK